MLCHLSSYSDIGRPNDLQCKCGPTGHDTGLQAQLPPGVVGVDALMTSQLNVAMIRKVRASLVRLNYFVYMLSLNVCTTGH